MWHRRCWWRMLWMKFVGDNNKILSMVLAILVTNIHYLFSFASGTNGQNISPTSTNRHQHHCYPFDLYIKSCHNLDKLHPFSKQSHSELLFGRKKEQKKIKTKYRLDSKSDSEFSDDSSKTCSRRNSISSTSDFSVGQSSNSESYAV